MPDYAYSPRPAFGHVTETRCRAIVSAAAEPQRRRRMAWDSALRRIRLTWDQTGEGEVRAQLDAESNTAYGVLPMEYTEPRAIAPIRVALSATELPEREQLGPNAFAMSATVEEVR